MKVFVAGAAGQLGRAICAEFAAGHTLIARTRAELDLTDHAAVLADVSRERPDWIINCSAYNDVDGAEEHAATALQVNAFAVRSLAVAARLVGATLVHYSTDFVFDGLAETPYTEADQPSPQSVYGASKLLGEWFAREAERCYVLRVASLFGGPLGRSSIDRIADALLGGREARVFHDRTVSPSYVPDVAAATRALFERGAPDGLYHCVNAGATTWSEIGEAIARLLNRPARLVYVSVKEVTLKASRPQRAALSNAKLAEAGMTLPPWQDAVERYLRTRTPHPAP